MRIREIIVAHPQGVSEPKRDALVHAIQSCFDCGHVCVACADACLAEDNVQELRSVIRATNDTADICLATAKMLTRLTAPPWNILKAQVQSCIQAVRDTGDLCQEHARMHEHCRICLESCRACESGTKEYTEIIKG